jgi:hypothetical protein
MDKMLEKWQEEMNFLPSQKQGYADWDIWSACSLIVSFIAVGFIVPLLFEGYVFAAIKVCAVSILFDCISIYKITRSRL